MFKFIKYITMLLSLTFVFSLTSKSVLANESNEEIYGGWSEDEGYWSNERMSRANNKPEKHWPVISQKEAGGVVYTKVTAHTEWKGVYHYSRAYFQGFFGIEGDSGRVWGYDKTKASSDWVDKFLSVAKTKWGR